MLIKTRTKRKYTRIKIFNIYFLRHKVNQFSTPQDSLSMGDAASDLKDYLDSILYHLVLSLRVFNQEITLRGCHLAFLNSRK